LLNPGIPIVTSADRVAGVTEARQAGADIAVLDDAFQHRRVARMEDVVLVSADRWREPVRLLPAGPWREAPRALSRASLVLVTRKAVDAEQAETLRRHLAPMTRTNGGAVAELALGDLRDAVTGMSESLSVIRGARVLVAAGVGDPESFASQLRRAGAHVEMRVFRDHHGYDLSDVARLSDEASSFDHIMCTLKDVVKLGPLWPRKGPPLWYVSLRCVIESGHAEVSAMLDRVMAARSTQTR
jgi:tetraacyldisaccharide 4'-kinase